MFSLTVKAFVMFVRFLLIHRKGPKNNIEIFLRKITLNKKPLDPQLRFTRLTVR